VKRGLATVLSHHCLSPDDDRHWPLTAVTLTVLLVST